jgi:hypothetical protein
MEHYARPDDVSATVFDPEDDTFGPIMAAIQRGDFGDAAILLTQLEEGLLYANPPCEPHTYARGARRPDFKIASFEGQRVAVPETDAAVSLIREHGGLFDLGDDGIELDTSDDAYGKAVAFIFEHDLTVSGIEYKEGMRLRLRHDVERYPHFIAPAGAVGTVTCVDSDVLCLRLDEHLPGAEEWDNEVVWSIRDGDDPSLDLQA